MSAAAIAAEGMANASNVAKIEDVLIVRSRYQEGKNIFYASALARDTLNFQKFFALYQI
ncbi:hypothetical protein [Novosphingobium sp. CECT 9465]|uniref:hypothetical protein n=1 Tax=Novosphingobium sp. CECT 9465 TaxID=2829794 RepID=UPI001E60B7E3|nr:hypothetical protein [Novosphingobium sp. CECT 9465]